MQKKRDGKWGLDIYISHHDVVCVTWTYKYTLHSPKGGCEPIFTPPTPSYYEYITPPSWMMSSSMTSPPPSWILPKGLRRHLESSLWDLEAILNPLLFMLIDGGIPLLPMETPYTTYSAWDREINISLFFATFLYENVAPGLEQAAFGLWRWEVTLNTDRELSFNQCLRY